MLNDEVIDKLTEKLVKRIESLNDYILRTIGHNIKKISGTIIPSDAQKLAQILKYGGDYEKILNKLEEITNLNRKDIIKIFDEVAKQNQLFAKEFYNYRNVKYIPYNKNEELQRQVKALASLTINEFENLTKTSALGFGFYENGKFKFKGLKKTYYEILDKAVLGVGQGKESFDTSLFRTLKELGGSSLRVQYKNGYTKRLDSAVRMNLQDGLRNLNNELQKQFGEEFDSDGYEISVHSYPAIDHEDVQGKQFTKEEFEKFQNGEKCKTYDGEEIDHMHNGYKRRAISTMNCYHYIFNVVLGISKPQYSKEQLNKINKDNKKGFEYKGHHYTMYEGTQLQRKFEMQIKKYKEMNVLASESENDDLTIYSNNKVKTLYKEYRNLCKISGLKERIERTRTI